MKLDYCYIIVDYKSPQRTIEYINHIIDKSNIDVGFVIIDNGGCDSVFFEEVSFRFKTYYQGSKVYDSFIRKRPVFLICPKGNLGYAKGNNIGIDFVKSTLNIEYIIVSNNDLRVDDEILRYDLFETIFIEHPDVSIIGPSVYGTDGKRQSPGKKMGISKRWIIPNVIYPLYKLFVADLWHDIDSSLIEGYVYRISGAYMVCKTRDIDLIGGFDENTFLYAEEPIIAEKLNKLNKKVFYTSKIHILHYHDQTIGNHYSSYEKIRIRFNSECYYYREYIKTGNISIAIARLSLEFFILKLRIVDSLKSMLAKVI